jgi:NAD(P)-dependent dehydrogenase (short-subunit alcohol dehydrogenase family)
MVTDCPLGLIGLSSRRFDGKAVVVTGGGSGIGKATAERFFEDGARVAIFEISRKNGEAAVAELKRKGHDPLLLIGDVSKSADVKRMVKAALKKMGRIDVLFNNAGILVEGTIERVSERDYDRIMAINVKGTFLVSKEVIPIMLRQGKGAIVNNASCSGLVGDRDAIAYNTSKGAVVLMTKCLALDYAQKNIRANCVCPGEIETPMFHQEAHSRKMSIEKYRKVLSEVHPIGRLGVPEEVANVVLFLASDDASFITGTAFSVDGGYTCQ